MNLVRRTMLGVCLSTAATLFSANILAADEPLPAAADRLAGNWQGALKVGAVELRLVLKIVKDAKQPGGFKATLDSVDQGAKDIPIDTVTLNDAQVKLASKLIKAAFEGTLSEDGQELVGQWKQNGSLPLTFQRVEKPFELVRPQEPKKPYPYREDEVAYENRGANIKLAGTLTLPKSEWPTPAVILLSGSGPQDRNESLMGHKPFLVLADALTRRGIAVLRVDDRGVGGSTGSTSAATTEDFAADALAGVAYLKTRKEIDPAKIGLAGHSEGGMVAALAASRSPDVAFIIMLAGTGVPGEEILYRQGQLIAKAGGADAAKLALQRDVQQRMFEALKTEKDLAAAEKRLQEIADESLAKLSEDDAGKESAAAQARAQVKSVLSPWFRYFLTYDPRPALRKVSCPVLALNGERDLQVDPKQNLPEIEAALKEGGNRDCTCRTMIGLNHLFQLCRTGSPSEYAKIEETFAPEALELIGDWILERFAGETRAK